MSRARLIIPGFSVISELHRGKRRAVYRARSGRDDTTVILKTYLDRVPRPQACAELQREAAIVRQVVTGGVPTVLGLELRGSRPALILQDLAGEPLSSLIAAGTLSLISRVEIARNIARILGVVHAKSIVHRDINPTNLLADSATRRTAILDFGLAETLAALELPRATSLLVGTPAYVSPEQTGRTGWDVDQRSDLYSLGVTLYELLCGRRPFESSDTLKVVHAHIALQPPPPQRFAASLPRALRGIVLKLLAKSPEGRYQSAAGLETDLARCLSELGEGRVPEFQLGTADFGDRLAVPRRLFGRVTELAALHAARERSKRGPGEILLVAGYSGIGKTSLVRELVAPVTEDGGYFVSGKFDQLVRGTPYTALRSAFAELARQLLMETDDDVRHWRERLLDVLGSNGQVVLDLLPEFGPILGPQPGVPALGPAEAQNRFQRLLKCFLGALARSERPLVVFLDDLQWVDSASSELLHAILDGPLSDGLLFVGAYRDNEVGEDHSLVKVIAAAQASGVRVTRITLPPIDETSLYAFVRETLRGNDAHAAPLAEVVQAKTGGNPFFIAQFMKSLAQQELLKPDHGQGLWRFDLPGIRRQPSTDNVIDLLAGRIGRLGPRSRSALKTAACLGNRFDEQTLAIAWNESVVATRTALREALVEGLLVGVDAGSADRAYRFLHDRVQQAAYALHPEAERPDLHLRIGRGLLAALDPSAREERVFELLDQIRPGLALVCAGAEADTVRSLALLAGRKARAAAAYVEAAEYYGVCRALLPADAWSSDYEGTFELSLCIAECQYLSAHFDAAVESLRQLDARAASPLDQARVQILRAAQFETRSNYADAVAAIRAGLASLGIAFPAREGFAAALSRDLDEVAASVGERPTSTLISLPVMDDAATKMCMRLLASAWSCTYILGDADLIAWIPTRMVLLSLRHGNTEESAYGYVAHGITLGTRRGDYRRGQEFGLLALALNQALDDLPFRGKVQELFGCFVNLWRRPLLECIESQRAAFLAGIEGGDFVYGTYGGFVETWYRLLTCDVLARLERDSAPTLEFLRSIHNHSFVAAERLILNWALALRGLTNSAVGLDAEGLTERGFLEVHREPAFFQAFFHIIKLHLFVTMREYASACASADAGEALIASLTGTIWPMLLCFYGALARAATFAGWRVRGRAEAPSAPLLARLRESAAKLAEWARNCPQNFLHAELLVRAEISRICNEGTPTEDLYVAAIEAASIRGFPGDLALAHERYGLYRLEQGQQRVASMFLLEAMRVFDGWGAAPKAEQLADELAELLGVQQSDAGSATLASPAAVLSTLRSPSQTLDFGWAMQAAGAISSEIELTKLLETLMRTLLESAGAERGCLLLESGDTALVRVRGDVARGEISVHSVSTGDSNLLPESVWRYVRRTRESVVLHDASADPAYVADPYVQSRQPRSLICIPVLYQTRLLGAVYLENNLHAGAFTRNHLYLLQTLSAHAAIALRNAELFDQVARLEERLRAENVYLQEKIRTQHDFEEIIGESPALMRVLEQVEQVAPTDSTVLILGETGTGKELLARAIHRRSLRRDGPLITVNCGAISPGLIESEFFGHEKGAFTGAIARKIGRFELAEGGTILLDEIGDLALDLQVKLLRVLQEGEIERVGGSHTIPIDVRVIAGTHQDLAAAVEQREFRADLYYRLNVFPIEIPPLRDRRDDIHLLVRHFVMKDGPRLGKRLETIPRRTLEALLAYQWPGNVRELRNVIERSIITSRGAALELGAWFTSAPSDAHQAADASEERTLDEVQRDHILRILERCGWVVSGPKGAALRLGLKPTTLEARMRKLGVQRPR